MNGPPSYDDDDDSWMFDPGVASISRRIEREIREEAHEGESATAESELRNRTFADVAKEARNRGDRVSVTTEHRNFSGFLQYASKDFLTVETETFVADVNLEAIIYLRVIESGGRGGKALQAGPGTFEMRLWERRSPLDRVELGFRATEETIMGRIVVVGQDHVVLLDDQRDSWTVPFSAIAWIVRRGRGVR